VSHAVLTLNLGEGSEVTPASVEKLKRCLEASPGDVTVHARVGNTLLVCPQQVKVGPPLLALLKGLCNAHRWEFAVDGAPPPPRRATKAAPPPARRKS
jgi:hypothetical protein